MMRAMLIAAALLAPVAAGAQQRQQAPRQDDLGQSVDRNLRSCVGQNRDVAHVRSCMDGQRAALEPRLRAAVDRVLAAQPTPERRAAAEGVQAAWTNYRDTRCAFAGGNPQRGEEAPIDEAACMLQFTVGRVMEVEALLQPVPAPPPQQQRR